jgi:hypothetical protein
MLDGLGVAVIPAGAVADRATEPAKPAMEIRPILDVCDVPCTMVRLVGLAVREKSGVGAVTSTKTSVRWTRGQPVPLMSTT